MNAIALCQPSIFSPRSALAFPQRYVQIRI